MKEERGKESASLDLDREDGGALSRNKEHKRAHRFWICSSQLGVQGSVWVLLVGRQLRMQIRSWGRGHG